MTESCLPAGVNWHPPHQALCSGPAGSIGSSEVPSPADPPLLPTPDLGASLTTPVHPLLFPVLPSPQKLFVVPADEAQARIPYSRVNHNKYMVTERATYIGKCPSITRVTEGGRVPPWTLTLLPTPQERPTGLAATLQRRRAPRYW